MQKLKSSHYKIIAFSSLGGLLELFDFTIYAFFARYISANFFPNENYWLGLLNTFGIFFAGYCARPLGGIIFGHFGDKFGRRNVLAISAFLMAGATLLMGCLPTYQQIGPLAPLLLLLLRIVQGISVGGEIPGSTIFTLEHLGTHRPGFAVSLIFTALTLGNALCSILGYALTVTLSEQQMLNWGWRIPFVSGFLLGIVAYWLRRKALETPIFLSMQQKLHLHKIPALKLIQSALPQLFIAISLTAVPAASVFFFLYLPSYSPIQALFKFNDFYLMNSFNFLSLSFFTAFFGFCSDYIEKRKLMLFGVLLVIVASYFLVSELQQADKNILLFSSITFLAFVGIVNGCYGRTIIELFPLTMRYSGMAIAYNLGFALFGGAAPFIMTTLFQLTHIAIAPFFFLLFSCMVTLLGLLFLKSKPIVTNAPRINRQLQID